MIKKERLSVAMESSSRKPNAVDLVVTDDVTVGGHFLSFLILVLPDSTTMQDGNKLSESIWIVPGTILSTILSFHRAHVRSRLSKVTR